MRSIFWQLLIAVVLIAYAANWATIVPVGGDEKIYVIASSWLDRGFVANGEHPPLVKLWYQLLLSKEYKEEVMSHPDFLEKDLWIPNYYRFEGEEQLITSGTIYLRLVNGFLICALLLFIWWHSEDFTLFLALFSLMFAGDLIFTALLDGWLIASSLLGYYLVSVGLGWPFGWLLSLIVAPLTKFYGFLTTPFAIFKARTALQFSLAIVAVIFTLGFLWGVNSIFDGLYHYSHQLGLIPDPQKGAWGWAFYGFPIRYTIPFIGIALIKYSLHRNDVTKKVVENAIK